MREDAGGCGREAGRYGERYDPFLHLSRGHYYTAQPCSRYVRHLPSLLTITCHFVSLLTVSSAHTKTKKPKSVNLCSAQLISARLRRAHGQKTNKKTGPRSRSERIWRFCACVHVHNTHIPVNKGPL